MTVASDYVESLDEGQRITLKWVTAKDTRQLVWANRAVALPAFFFARLLNVDPSTDGRTVAAAAAALALGCVPSDEATRDALNRLKRAAADLPFESQTTLLTELETLRRGLTGLANIIVEEGIPIDPGFGPDLMVLAQLCALPRDEWQAAEKSQFHWGAPSTHRTDGRGSIHRDGLGLRGRQRADRIALHIREHQAGSKSKNLRSKGGRPQGALGKGSDSELLRKALPEVLEKYPNATTKQLREWTGSTNTPGVMLRSRMGRSVNSPRPSADAIQKARRFLRSMQ